MTRNQLTIRHRAAQFALFIAAVLSTARLVAQMPLKSGDPSAGPVLIVYNDMQDAVLR